MLDKKFSLNIVFLILIVFFVFFTESIFAQEITQLESPKTKRLFFMPTGYCLERGKFSIEGYLEGIDPFTLIPMIGYGVTENITVSGGVSIIPEAGKDQFYYGSAQLGLIKRDKVALSAVAFAIRVPLEELLGASTFGILSGIGTYDNKYFGITGGVGWGFADGDFAEDPMFVLGGELKIAKDKSVLAEDLFFPGFDLHFLIGGMRISGLSGKNLSLEIGFLASVRDGEISFSDIPHIGFHYYF
jgi:hypothetical protein